MMPVNFHDELVIKTLSPTIIIVCLLTWPYLRAFISQSAAKKAAKAAKEAGNERTEADIIADIMAIAKAKRIAMQGDSYQYVVTILFLVYPTCSSAVFNTFSCDLMDDGKEYLKADYSIDCIDHPASNPPDSPDCHPLPLSGSTPVPLNN